MESVQFMRVGGILLTMHFCSKIAFSAPGVHKVVRNHYPYKHLGEGRRRGRRGPLFAILWNSAKSAGFSENAMIHEILRFILHFRILPRSSSLREPRDPSLKGVFCSLVCFTTLVGRRRSVKKVSV